MSKAVSVDAPEQPGVAAVSRAVSILSAFQNADLRLSLAEISRRTGLYKSTILRLADTLERHSLLVRDNDGEFRLGVELIRLGDLAKRSSGGSEQITSVLQRLVEQTGESATYYVRRGSLRLALYRADSGKSVRDHIRAGDLLPLERGAAGRVLTQQRPDTNVVSFRTITSLGERDPDVAAVAGPVYSGGNVIGALSVSGPRSRFSDDAVAKFTAAVEDGCRALSGLV